MPSGCGCSWPRVPGPRRAGHGPPAPARDRRHREPPSAPGTLIGEIKDIRVVLGSAKPAAGAAVMLPLTPAELLLPYLQTHLTADKIAERLFISGHTVRTEVRAIYRKLGVSSCNDAIQKAQRSACLVAS